MTDGISQDRIVDVALGRLAHGGLPALAMRGIATDLGVQQSALYWHFANKQQLLGAVADRIVSSVGAAESRGESSGDETWEARTASLAARLRADLLAYPDGAELVASAFAFRLGGRQPYERLVRELEDTRLDAEAARVAATVLVHFAFGFVTDEQQHHQAAAVGAIDPAPSSSRDDHPAPGSETASADERFAAGIRLILDGVATQLR